MPDFKVKGSNLKVANQTLKDTRINIPVNKEAIIKCLVCIYVY